MCLLFYFLCYVLANTVFCLCISVKMLFTFYWYYMFTKFIVGDKKSGPLGDITCFSLNSKCLNAALKSRAAREGAMPMTQ